MPIESSSPKYAGSQPEQQETEDSKLNAQYDEDSILWFTGEALENFLYCNHMAIY